MDATVRVKSVFWMATAIVLSVFATLLVMQEWRADAASSSKDATWVPIEPCRLFDYRAAEPPAGGKKTPLVAGDVVTQQVTGPVGNCNIPTASVLGVSLNVTAVNGTAKSNLRLYPADGAKPLVSNLNWSAGDSPVANKVDVKLSSSGRVKLLNHNGRVDVVADVVGYYTTRELESLANADFAHDIAIAGLEQRIEDMEAASAPLALTAKGPDGSLGANTDTTLVSMPFVAPADGGLSVESASTIWMSGTNKQVHCSISLNGSPDSGYRQSFEGVGSNDFHLSGTRLHILEKGDSVTVSLACESGIDGGGVFRDPILTAIFIPMEASG